MTVLKKSEKDITTILESMWEDKRKPATLVTGKGGYILYENILRKELGIPLLTEEEIKSIPEGAYKL